MKRILLFLIILQYSIELSGQVIVEANQINGSQFQFVNKNNRQPVNDQVWDEVESFVNGYAKVVSGNRWNLVNLQGNTISKTGFDMVRNMLNKRAAVQLAGKWGFIDEQGKIVIPGAYDIVFDFREAVTGVYKNNKWFLINKQGVILKQLDLDIFYGFKNGTARINRKGINGLMNTSGNIISMENQTIKSTKNAKANNLSVNSAMAGSCPDNINFESGNFTNWKTFTGSVAAVGTTNVITVNPSAPTPNRHVIYAASTPSALDPYGLFPTNPPDGSRYALKLGNNINGSQAERVSYQINVPANAIDASITYRYAVVFQDPGHLVYQQPRFIARLLDVATNTYLPCASFEYVSDDGLPGFYSSSVDDSVKCRAWSSVFINLSAYPGKSMILEFTTADCTRGAHWGYAYVDVGDCNVSASLDYQCNPSQVFLKGPPGFQYYNWWNTDYTAIMDTGFNASLTPAPPPHTISDSLSWIWLQRYAGCGSIQY
jgi:hypothetical protein